MNKQKCEYAKFCGSCQNLDKEYNETLAEKTRYVKGLFKVFDGVHIEETSGLYYPFKKRNKIHLAFGENKGKTLIGFFEERSNKVVDIKSCLMHDVWATQLIAILREYISRFKIRAYKNGIGILRYAHARCIDGRLQLTLVAVTENFAGRDWLYKKLCENFTRVSFYLNINRRTDKAIFGDKMKFVAGDKFLKFRFCGVDVSLTPYSFLQVNLDIAEKMYKKAVDLLELKSNTTVIDLYSGIGITSVMFAKNCKQVFAIEEVANATDNAKIIAKNNNITNINIFTGKCENKILSLTLDGEDDVVLFVDPARVGLDKKVIEVVKTISPRKIVYMSCNPESCARDMQLLDNYKLASIYPYDMFAYTSHVELLCLLEKI